MDCWGVGVYEGDQSGNRCSRTTKEVNRVKLHFRGKNNRMQEENNISTREDFCLFVCFFFFSSKQLGRWLYNLLDALDAIKHSNKGITKKMYSDGFF